MSQTADHDVDLHVGMSFKTLVPGVATTVGLAYVGTVCRTSQSARVGVNVFTGNSDLSEAVVSKMIRLQKDVFCTKGLPFCTKGLLFCTKGLPFRAKSLFFRTKRLHLILVNRIFIS